jgi:hypothetical protein
MAKQVSAQEQKVKESSVDQKAVENAKKRVEKFREGIYFNNLSSND